ncbi:hypothetical protein SLNWT_1268 [Streptomyces albus]|uniref:Uncharacterized protein n=1 Tax=Streptomyces albus (strain ATCC 21838 / DSM 41398 / FERM P-419 / JCM 4703 / NBRC 107858) TaxID=1081613 RepID=A0A0B5EJG8_STRA4|nr:hypothetical protein SLNWT_1268 [Streptomyces albus]
MARRRESVRAVSTVTWLRLTCKRSPRVTSVRFVDQAATLWTPL